MFTVLIIFIIIAAILMIGIVLIQKSKGGGLASNFAGSNQIMGVRRTNSFVEKATWTLAIVVCLLSILSAFFIERPQLAQNDSRLKVVQTTTIAKQDLNTPATPAEPTK